MPHARIPAAKQAAILAALSEGTPIRAVCRIFKTSTDGVSRIIEETGRALIEYMHANFKNLPCERVELDEQWQYVGMHGQRMTREEKKDKDRGDFWLWCAIDSDSKLLFSFLVGGRDRNTGTWFMNDMASRVRDGVQIASDNYQLYPYLVAGAFGQRRYTFGTETKTFSEPRDWPLTPAQRDQKNGIPKMAHAQRKAIVGRPDLSTLTTAHVERVFLSMRQELTRYTRRTLGYSKSLRMHKLAVAVQIGLYNLVRRHKSLDGQTPAQAAGIEDKRWTLEDVVRLTADYMRRKEEEKFEAAFNARRASLKAWEEFE